MERGAAAAFYGACVAGAEERTKGAVSVAAARAPDMAARIRSGMTRIQAPPLLVHGASVRKSGGDAGRLRSVMLCGRSER